MSEIQTDPLLLSVETMIFTLRGQRVMLSPHLAELYLVEPKVLIQSVKRNIERFPEDFMFQLTKEEMTELKSQFVTLTLWTPRANPYAFTEQGVAMLSGVLRSPRAIEVNIEIMRTFVRLRRLLAGNAELAQKLDELETKTDERFKAVFDALRQLMTPPPSSTRKIGIRREETKRD